MRSRSVTAVLARYSGEHTIFREVSSISIRLALCCVSFSSSTRSTDRRAACRFDLKLLQNADDALAQSVQLRFYTKSGVEAEERSKEGVAESTSALTDGPSEARRVPDFKKDDVRTLYLFP